MKKIIIVLSVAYAVNTNAGEKNNQGTIITTHRGDEITMSIVPERKVNIQNSATTKVIAIGKPEPVLLNGKEIHKFTEEDFSKITTRENIKVWGDEYVKFNTMLDAIIEEEKKLLPPGKYTYKLNQMVVDEYGYIAYYETEGIKLCVNGANQFTKTTTSLEDQAIASAINNKIAPAIDKMRYTPFILDGKARAYISSHGYTFTVDTE